LNTNQQEEGGTDERRPWLINNKACEPGVQTNSHLSLQQRGFDTGFMSMGRQQAEMLAGKAKSLQEIK
jgi:hypothetical protein